MPRRDHLDLDVSQDIIDSSVRESSSHCMIADAVKAAIPEARFVSVDLQTIRWSQGEKRYVVLTPRTGQLALLDFDQGINPVPFKIRLNLRTAQIRDAVPVSSDPEAQEARRQVALRRAESRRQKAAKLVGGSGGNVPGINDGTSPPLGPLAHPKSRVGTRRSFGLKQLGS